MSQEPILAESPARNTLYVCRGLSRGGGFIYIYIHTHIYIYVCIYIYITLVMTLGVMLCWNPKLAP